MLSQLLRYRIRARYVQLVYALPEPRLSLTVAGECGVSVEVVRALTVCTIAAELIEPD